MPNIYIGHTDDTPLGKIWVAMNEKGLIAVEFPATQDEFTNWLQKHHNAKIEFSLERVKEVVTQLEQYVAG